jgi:hypothetical protein
MKDKRALTLAACAYAILTIYLYYPALPHPLTQVISYPQGGTSGDQWVYLWNLWWVKYSLLDLGANPFVTSYLFYPNVASLAMNEATLLNGLLSAPFQILIPDSRGLVLAYNVIFRATAFLSGLSVFILVRHLTDCSMSAFVCGLIYMLLPYKIAQCIHLNLLSLQYLPIYLLFFHKTLYSTEWRNPLFAAIAFFFIIWTCYQYVVFTVLLSLVFLIFFALLNFKEMREGKRLQRILLLAACSFLALFPNVFMIISLPARDTPPFWQTLAFSPDFLGFLLPPETIIWSKVLRAFPMLDQIYQERVSGLNTYLGVTLVFFAIVGGLKAPKKEVLPWALTAAAFVVLTLGPYFTVLGKRYETIPLPYLFFYKYLPLFNSSRAPFRFVIVAELCLLVLAGYGIKASLAKPTQTWKRTAIFILMILLVMLDYGNAPYRTLRMEVPQIYQKIAKEEGAFAIFDSPYTQYHDVARYMFYQTTHHKPIWHGLTSRKIFLKSVPAKSRLPKPEVKSTDLEALKVLREYNTRYLITHFSDRARGIYGTKEVVPLDGKISE